MGNISREKLERAKLGKALAKTVGSLKSEDYPEFATSEDVARWMRELRQCNFENQKHYPMPEIKLYQP